MDASGDLRRSRAFAACEIVAANISSPTDIVRSPM